MSKELISDKVIASNDDPELFQISRNKNNKLVAKSFEKVYKNNHPGRILMNRRNNFQTLRNSKEE